MITIFRFFFITLIISVMSFSAIADRIPEPIFGIPAYAAADTLNLSSQQTDPSGYVLDVEPESPEYGFAFYQVAYSEQCGVTKIVASSLPIHDEGYGDYTNRIFVAISEELEHRFGRPRTYRSLDKLAIWSLEQRGLTFLQALEMDEFELTAMWRANNSQTNPLFMNDIDYIILETDFVSPTPFIRLIVLFEGHDECHEHQP